MTFTKTQAEVLSEINSIIDKLQTGKWSFFV